MKKILILISFVACFISSFGQYPVVQRSSPVNTVKDPRLMAGFNFYPPQYLDTLTANIAVNLGIDSCGALIYTYNTNSYWYRGCSPKRWIQMITGIGVAGDIITIINDSSITVCSFVNNVASLCDTFNITNIGAIQTVTIINDSTLLVCAESGGLPLCDTLHIPPSNFSGISASNMVRMASPTNIRVGGNAIETTTTDTRSFVWNLTGNTIYNYSHQFATRHEFNAGTGITSFKAFGGPTGQIDNNNQVKLGIDYTGKLYTNESGLNGYFGEEIGYFIGVNASGNGSFGLRTSNVSSKVAGIIINTLDSSTTKAVSIYGKHPPQTTFIANPTVGGVGMQPYEIATFHDNKNITFYGYDTIRNDGGTSRALYTDASGNVKIGPINSGSTVNIINDTTINICSFVSNVPSLCDTITINNIGNIQEVTIINDSTISVCGTSGCDTLVVPQADFNPGITANNALRMSTPTNVQLGSPTAPGAALIQNTFIDATSGYTLYITGSRAANPVLSVTTTATSVNESAISATGTGGSSAIVATTSTGYGLSATSTTGTSVLGSATSTGLGGYFLSSTGVGLQASSVTGLPAKIISFNGGSVNNITPVLALHRETTSTSANGIGGSLDLAIEPLTGGDQIANQIIWKWTEVTTATRTSQFIITGVNSAITADLFTLSGNGALQLNKYGVGTFTAGTPAYGAAWDASGNFMEVALSGGVYTASSGLTMTANNTVLGGTALSGNTTIPTSAFSLAINSSSTGVNGATLILTNTSSTGIGIAMQVISTGISVASSGSGSIAIQGTSAGGGGGVGVYGIGLGTSNPIIAQGAEKGVIITISPVNGDAVVPILEMQRSTDGAAANGIGQSIDFSIINVASGQIINKFTDITGGSEISQFDIMGVNTTPETYMNIQTGGIVIVNNLTDTLATKAYARSSGGGGGGGWNNTGTVATLAGASTLAQATFDFTFDNGDVLFTALAGNGAGIVAVDNDGRISFTAAGGSGNVSAGTVNRLGYYAATGTTISEWNAITASRALVSNANGLPVASTTTTTQIQLLSSATGTTGTTSTNIVFSASPTFSGTVVIPSPFTLGATSVTTTGARLNFLTSAGGTTGTTSTNIVFSTSPTLTTPTLTTPTLTTPIINVGSDASFDMYYRNGSGLFTRLPNGTTNQVITATTGAAPSWATPAAGGGITVGSTTITGGTTTRILYQNGSVVGQYTLTGTGTVVAMQTSPTLVTPILGVATATSINKVTITAPATSAVLTILNGKTFTVNKTITLDGTDFQTYTFPTTNATIARTDAAQTFSGTQTFNGNVTLNNTLFSGYSITTNSQAGTTYTILSTDNGDVVDFTSGTAVTVTVPAGLPTGFNCTIRQLGAGQITLSASGTTLRNFNGETKTGGQWAVINLLWLSSNNYTISGETGP